MSIMNTFMCKLVADGGVGRVYTGAPYQRGYGGSGSFLAGIFQRVLPLITCGAKAVDKETLRTGMNMRSDVATDNTPFRESLRNRVRESGQNLKRKAEEKLDKMMEGYGYKTPRLSGSLQLLHSSGAIKTYRKKMKTKKKQKKLSGVIKGKLRKKI